MRRFAVCPSIAWRGSCREAKAHIIASVRGLADVFRSSGQPVDGVGRKRGASGGIGMACQDGAKVKESRHTHTYARKYAHLTHTRTRTTRLNRSLLPGQGNSNGRIQDRQGGSTLCLSRSLRNAGWLIDWPPEPWRSVDHLHLVNRRRLVAR